MTFRQKAAEWDEASQLYAELAYRINDPFQLTDYEKDMEKFHEMLCSELYTKCFVHSNLEGGMLLVDYLVIP